MVPNELPFVVFAYLAAATLVAALQHDLGTSVGLIGLALAVLSTGALVVIVWRATRTRGVVASAMRDSLGIDVPRSRLAMLHILLAPFVVTRRDVERARGHPLWRGRKPRARHLPAAPSRRDGTGARLLPRRRLSRRRQEPRGQTARLPAREPRVAVRRARATRFVPLRSSESLADAHAALSPGLEPARVSSGSSRWRCSSPAARPVAISRLSVALTDPTIAGAVSLYGYYGTAEDGQPLTSPLGLAGPDAPPLFVAHGDNDTYVPVEAARELVARVREVSANPVVYVELPGAQHSFDLFRSIRFERLIDGIDAFTGWVRAGHTSASVTAAQAEAAWIARHTRSACARHVDVPHAEMATRRRRPRSGWRASSRSCPTRRCPWPRAGCAGCRSGCSTPRSCSSSAADGIA